MADSAEDIMMVVVNPEEQYSVWFYDREPPAGWRTVYGPAARSECLAHIKEVWTDMRPLTVRRRLDASN